MDKDPNNPQEDNSIQELQDSINSLSEKFDTTLGDLDSRLDTFGERLDSVPKPEDFAGIKPSEEDGQYVPKGWKAADWNEAFAKTEEIADKKVEERLEAYKNDIATEADEKKKKNEAVNQEWDRQLTELEKAGKIPKIESETDPNDPGRAARRELFQMGVDYDSTNLIKMSELRSKIKSVEPEGASAPVGSGSRTTEPAKDINYEDIKNKGYDQILAEEFPDIYKR